MYRIKVKSSFSGAHNLRGHKGKCEALHGHNWHVELEIRSERLDGMGMVADFKDVSALLVEVISELDHKYLNDLEHFTTINPTSENIAEYVYGEISRKKTGLDISGVTVWETKNSAATYSR